MFISFFFYFPSTKKQHQPHHPRRFLLWKNWSFLGNPTTPAAHANYVTLQNAIISLCQLSTSTTTLTTPPQTTSLLSAPPAIATCALLCQAEYNLPALFLLFWSTATPTRPMSSIKILKNFIIIQSVRTPGPPPHLNRNTLFWLLARSFRTC